jgi:hypothetical protein
LLHRFHAAAAAFIVLVADQANAINGPLKSTLRISAPQNAGFKQTAIGLQDPPERRRSGNFNSGCGSGPEKPCRSCRAGNE